MLSEVDKGFAEVPWVTEGVEVDGLGVEALVKFLLNKERLFIYVN